MPLNFNYLATCSENDWACFLKPGPKYLEKLCGGTWTTKGWETLAYSTIYFHVLANTLISTVYHSLIVCHEHSLHIKTEFS